MSALTVDLSTGIASRNGVQVRLTPRVAETLFILNERVGSYVSSDRFIQGLSGWGDPMSEGNVRMHVWKAKKAVEPLGCRVECNYSIGWRLIIDEPKSFGLVLPIAMKATLERLAAGQGVSLEDAATGAIALAARGG